MIRPKALAGTAAEIDQKRKWQNERYQTIQDSTSTESSDFKQELHVGVCCMHRLFRLLWVDSECNTAVGNLNCNKHANYNIHDPQSDNHPK